LKNLYIVNVVAKKTKPNYDKWGRPSSFIEGHNNRGEKGLKGGYHLTNGYKYILKPDHLFADSKGYVPKWRRKSYLNVMVYCQSNRK
jgi:hypothetical protein